MLPGSVACQASLSSPQEQGNHRPDPKAGATCTEWLWWCPLCPALSWRFPFLVQSQFNYSAKQNRVIIVYWVVLQGRVRSTAQERCPSSPWAAGSQAKSKFTLWPAVPDVRFQDAGCVRTDNTVVCQQVFWAYQSIQKLCCLLSISLHGWQHCLYAQKMQNILGTLVNDLKQGNHINRGKTKAFQCDRMNWTCNMMVPPQRTLLCTLRSSIQSRNCTRLGKVL